MLVSIGLPFYNNKGTLIEAIQSVLAQTYKDWELILVDDGSSDGSSEIARSVQDKRIRLVQDGHNVGLAGRLNQIAELARGSLLARMDADDIMHPERIAQQVHFMSEHPDVDLVGTCAYIMDEQGRVIGIRCHHTLSRTPRELLKTGLFIHPTVMGKTEWFRRNKYDVTLRRSEDFELWCRTFRTSRFALLKKPLLFYREGGFAINRYAVSARTHRRVIRRHGQGLVGRSYANYLIARSLGKQLAIQAGVRIGLRQAIMSRRSKPLDEASLRSAEEILAAVRSIRVDNGVYD